MVLSEMSGSSLKNIFFFFSTEADIEIHCGLPRLKFPFYISYFKSVLPNANKCSNFYILGLFCLNICK